MSKSKIGYQAICKYCNQDIEFQGKTLGWYDRGNNRQCVPYVDKKTKEVIKPDTKHQPYKD